jgi:glycosyltransferase involved in cell wall biosynthesis
MLVFVGALTQGKGPDRFVSLVEGMRAHGSPVRAQIMGDGPLRQELIGPTRAAGVELLGWRPDVAEVLRGADLLVFPSHAVGEGMPGVLIEAGLSGLPAVSTPVPGAATVLADGRTGVIVDDSVATIVEAVGRLLDDPVRRAAMGAAARSRCESEFTLDVMAHRWRSALQPMLNSQGGAARRGRTPLERSAIALRRSIRARRGSSHS